MNTLPPQSASQANPEETVRVSQEIHPNFTSHFVRHRFRRGTSHTKYSALLENSREIAQPSYRLDEDFSPAASTSSVKPGEAVRVSHEKSLNLGPPLLSSQVLPKPLGLAIVVDTKIPESLLQKHNAQVKEDDGTSGSFSKGSDANSTTRLIPKAAEETAVNNRVPGSFPQEDKIQVEQKSGPKPVEINRGPKIKVIIGDTQFRIPKRVLEEKAPMFLKENKGWMEVTYKVNVGGFSIVFEHWLRNGTLPGFGVVTKGNESAAWSLLRKMLYMYCIAQKYRMVNLMDVIMDTCVKQTAWKTSGEGVDFINSYYNWTLGPCGLRLFLIRDLVYHLCVRHKTLRPGDYELISRNTDMMRDFFKEMANQGYAGAPIKRPEEYGVCCYRDIRFQK